jgi:signal transduction histidine kinase
MPQAQPIRDSARQRKSEGPGRQNLGIDLDRELNSDADMGIGLGIDLKRTAIPRLSGSGTESGLKPARELRRESSYPGLSRTNPDLFGLIRPDIVPSGMAHTGTAHTDLAQTDRSFDTLTVPPAQSETFAEVAHDARNMVTALGLYCDLLEEPGVLATPFIHYGSELRLLAMASRRLVEKIVFLDSQITGRTDALPDLVALSLPEPARPDQTRPELARLVSARPVSARLEPARLETGPAGSAGQDTDAYANANPSASRRWDLLPAAPVTDMAAELVANRNLLAALAGPSIVLTVQAHGGARPVRLTGEDLTRVLVNLVKNSAEAMPAGGRIHIGLRETNLTETGPREISPTGQPAADAPAGLLLTVEDNGPGIPAINVETVFASGYTTHGLSEASNGYRVLNHHGLGLAISRSIVEGAGGRITAGNQLEGGACVSIVLPLRDLPLRKLPLRNAS